MVGYTALGQRNESLALALVDEQRKLIRPILTRHSGREIKTIGDAFLVEFPNALDAVRCAYDIQRATREFNISLPEEKRIHLRVGLHLGDVVESQGDISGDAVNVASRIEPLADDGGVCLTRQVYESTHNKFDAPFVSIGMKHLRNVNEPMEVYRMEMPWNVSGVTGASTFPTNKIAVLPFASLSLEPNDAFFADGVTDEIISAVAGISGLKVISRTSVIGYKGTTKKVKEIGKELGVGSILEGTFKKAGNRIRVTAQLIKVEDDEHLWARNYDRNLDDVFEVQSDVAKQVAEALRVKILTPEKERIEKRPTENTLAYTHYLKGLHFWNLRLSGSIAEMVENVQSALKCFEQAVAGDPRFTLGYVGLANCYSKFAEFHIEVDSNLEKAKMMGAKALELDPDLAEAHATRGLLFDWEYSFKDEESELKKAIELKPSYALAHYWYFNLLLNQQRWEEALEEIEKALELDPLSPVFNNGLAVYYFFRRDYNKAPELCRRAVELGVPAAHLMAAHSYGMTTMYAEMKREFAAYAETEHGNSSYSRVYADFYAAYYENDRRTCRYLIPQLEARFGEDRGFDATDVALACFCLEENDKGFEWLERSYSRRDVYLLLVKLFQQLDSVRDDPRYLDLVKRLGLEETTLPTH
jgi:adenylate cyclase